MIQLSWTGGGMWCPVGGTGRSDCGMWVSSSVWGHSRSSGARSTAVVFVMSAEPSVLRLGTSQPVSAPVYFLLWWDSLIIVSSFQFCFIASLLVSSLYVVILYVAILYVVILYVVILLYCMLLYCRWQRGWDRREVAGSRLWKLHGSRLWATESEKGQNYTSVITCKSWWLWPFLFYINLLT